MLTAKDVQSILHVDRSTVYRMAEAGQLPAVKVGRQWRFPSDQMHQWLNNQSATGINISKQNPAGALQNTVNNIESLLPLECIQLIQDTFADMLDVMIIITDMSGHPVTKVSKPCGPFNAIKEIPNALEKCIEDWAHFGEIIEMEPKLIRSHLGLLGTRGLIREGLTLKGMVIVGGIAPSEWPPAPEHIASIAAEFGVPANTFDPYLTQVSYLSKTQQARVLTIVQQIANIIAHIITERREIVGKLNAINNIICPK